MSQNTWLRKRSLEQLSSALPSVPVPVLEVVHKCYEDIPLDETQRSTINDYIVNDHELPSMNKSVMFKYLSGKKEYDMIETLGQHHLFDKEGNFMKDCATPNVRIYLESLILTNNIEKFMNAFTKYLSQFSITKQGTSVYMINYLFVKLYQQHPADVSLKIWAKLITIFYGHCELTSFEIYGHVLSHLLHFFKYSKSSHECVLSVLEDIVVSEGPSAANQLCSTLITFFSGYRWFGEVEKVWQWKSEKGLEITAPDLTAMMKTKCHFEEWDTVIQLHKKYFLAHNDYMQFDYLLIALAKKENWVELKSQFDALFGIGQLPTINHYGVVMFALSLHGELELVEKLHGQLIRRNMTPSYAVVLSLINANYITGNYNAAIREFSQFRRYDLRPTSNAYLLMLKVYKKVGSLDSCLKVLKTMSDSSTPIYEEHFRIIMDLCGKTNNHPVAEELFNVMASDYFIQPTGVSISSLLYIFIEAEQFDKARRLIEKYDTKVSGSPGEKHLIEKQKIYYFTRTKQFDKAEDALRSYFSKNYPRDSKFYLILLEHLVHGRKDLKSAEKVLEELCQNNSKALNANHFNILLEEYSKIGYLEGTTALIEKLVDNEIMMNSKTLYFLIRSRFELHTKRREPYDFLVGWLEEILENVAQKKLRLNSLTLHPSVITWPMKFLAKNDDPSKAVAIFSKYIELFFPDTKEWNQKLTILRALITVSAESERWSEFDVLFERYENQLHYYKHSPGVAASNKKLSRSFVGIMEYKVERMLQLRQVTALPDVLNKLEKDGYILGNKTWNEILWVLVRNNATFDYALLKINDIFIHGYTLIHRIRYLRKFDKDFALNDPLLHKLEHNPNSHKPRLYLTSENYRLIMIQIDKHLRKNCNRLEDELKILIKKYPYIMKNYLKENKQDVIKNWKLIEEKHASFFDKLRKSRKVPSVEEF